MAPNHPGAPSKVKEWVPLAVASSESPEGEENWEPGRGGGVMEEKSLRMELKIAGRDDVIEFPLLITPQYTYIETHIHTFKDTDTQGHKQRHERLPCTQ